MPALKPLALAALLVALPTSTLAQPAANACLKFDNVVILVLPAPPRRRLARAGSAVSPLPCAKVARGPAGAGAGRWSK
jgi:hypothetical protein